MNTLFDKKGNSPQLFAAEEHGSNIISAVRTFLVVGLLALAAWTPSRAAERVDLLLVLAADISRSVELGIAGPVIISGWSAGGHLTAFLLDHRKVAGDSRSRVSSS